MTETLQGVIIGGSIASIIPIIAMINDHIKWKKERKIEYLKMKKDKLEQKFKDVYKEISEGKIKEKYPVDVVSDITSILSENVSAEITKFIYLKSDDHEKVILALYDISRAMKVELKDIEKEIELVIK